MASPSIPPDRHRPRLHVTAPRNWCNDPNGPVHHAGRFHLFFQTFADAPHWGAPSWGHVSSRDLLHWDREPDALTPSADGPDRDGCWSGCCVVVDDVPRLIYTAVTGTEEATRTEAVAVAEGSPDLRHWRVRSAPLIAGPPADLGTGHHRDPFVLRDEHGWLLLLGSTTADAAHGRVLAYRSTDLERWHRVADHLVGGHTSGQAAEIDTGRLWECPQLLRTAGGDALLVAVQDPERTAQPLRGVLAHLGVHTPTGFEVRRIEPVDHGDVFYAPAITRDATGRWLCWGWVQDPLDAEEAAATSQVGALSLPRVLDVEADTLEVHPAPELVGLRAGPPLTLTTTRPAPGPAHEVILPAHPTPRELLLIDASGTPLLTVTSDTDGWQLHYPEPVPVPPQPVAWRHGPAQLRVLVDTTVVEVFAGDGRAATARLRGRRMVQTLALRGAVDAGVHELALPVA